MPIRHFINIKPKDGLHLFKTEFDPTKDRKEDIEFELAKVLKEEILQVIGDIDIDSFKNFYCDFSSYYEIDEEGIFSGDRVYY